MASSVETVFAEHDGARFARARYTDRIARRLVALVDRRAVLRRHVRGIHDIFDRDGHAVERPAARLPVARAGFGDHPVGREVRPRPHIVLALRDALEAGPGQVLGGEPSHGHLRGRRNCAELV